MNLNCIILLALAFYGAICEAYFASGPMGYGGVGNLGYNELCNTPCGAGYGAGYEVGYGCRTGCGGYGGCGSCGAAAVCDTCQCMKTVMRPNTIERIPYSCSRRVQSGACRSTCGLYSGGVYGGAGVGVGGAGYINSGYIY